MMIHKDVCIQFSLGGQPFEAVGFLDTGEGWVQGTEAIRRTDNDHLVRTDEDWSFVYEHRSELPPELNHYWLATVRTFLGSPGNVSLLLRDGTEWYEYWRDLDRQWFRGALMLRRRVVS